MSIVKAWCMYQYSHSFIPNLVETTLNICCFLSKYPKKKYNENTERNENLSDTLNSE